MAAIKGSAEPIEPILRRCFRLLGYPVSRIVDIALACVSRYQRIGKNRTRNSGLRRLRVGRRHAWTRRDQLVRRSTAFNPNHDRGKHIHIEGALSAAAVIYPREQIEAHRTIDLLFSQQSLHRAIVSYGIQWRDMRVLPSM